MNDPKPPAPDLVDELMAAAKSRDLPLLLKAAHEILHLRLTLAVLHARLALEARRADPETTCSSAEPRQRA
jgi:hypothetical protein